MPVASRSPQPPSLAGFDLSTEAAVGRMPVHRCARQMRVAWDRVLGDGQTLQRSLRDIGADELDLLR
jgi:hypothetical protein